MRLFPDLKYRKGKTGARIGEHDERQRKHPDCTKFILNGDSGSSLQTNQISSCAHSKRSQVASVSSSVSCNENHEEAFSDILIVTEAFVGGVCGFKSMKCFTQLA